MLVFWSKLFVWIPRIFKSMVFNNFIVVVYPVTMWGWCVSLWVRPPDSWKETRRLSSFAQYICGYIALIMRARNFSELSAYLLNVSSVITISALSVLRSSLWTSLEVVSSHYLSHSIISCGQGLVRIFTVTFDNYARIHWFMRMRSAWFFIVSSGVKLAGFSVIISCWRPNGFCN